MDETAEFTVTVTNNGPSTATNVEISFSPESGLAYVSGHARLAEYLNIKPRHLDGTHDRLAPRGLQPGARCQPHQHRHHHDQGAAAEVERVPKPAARGAVGGHDPDRDAARDRERV